MCIYYQTDVSDLRSLVLQHLGFWPSPLISEYTYATIAYSYWALYLIKVEPSLEKKKMTSTELIDSRPGARRFSVASVPVCDAADFIMIVRGAPSRSP